VGVHSIVKVHITVPKTPTIRVSAELTRRSHLHHLFDLQPTQKKVDETTPTTAKKTIGCHFP